MEETARPQKEKPLGGSPFARSVLDWTETIVMAVVLVTNLAGAAQQGDVVIVVNALEEPIIKRVVATEGQTVDFDPVLGEVLVDGVALPGSVFGIEDGITFVPDVPGQVLEFPQTVPEGCVFVLGDNRGHSTDSRFQSVGMVDQRNILGKVVFNIYPFSNLGFVS